MKSIIEIQAIADLHRDCIIRWKEQEIIFCHKDFFALVEENHAFNYQLWHAEDRARRQDMGYEFVYHAKREIDSHNQQRNNRMEAMDEWLFTKMRPAEAGVCPVHSETPGMMIDRLSILALKAYHMNLQVLRTETTEEHRVQCERKLGVIMMQQRQLQACLTLLIDEVTNKKRTFRVYHQFKMYNDPALNPELYQQELSVD